MTAGSGIEMEGEGDERKQQAREKRTGEECEGLDLRAAARKVLEQRLPWIRGPRSVQILRQRTWEKADSDVSGETSKPHQPEQGRGRGERTKFAQGSMADSGDQADQEYPSTPPAAAHRLVLAGDKLALDQSLLGGSQLARREGADAGGERRPRTSVARDRRRPCGPTIMNFSSTGPESWPRAPEENREPAP